MPEETLSGTSPNGKPGRVLRIAVLPDGTAEVGIGLADGDRWMWKGDLEDLTSALQRLGLLGSGDDA